MPVSRHPAREQVQFVISLYAQGKLQQALTQADHLLNEFPDSSILYNIQGASYVGLGQFNAAITSYQNALRINPADAKTHYNLGMACSESGDTDAAIDSFKYAIKITPDYALAYNGMGNALKDKGELEQAIKTYRQALKIEPEFAEVLNNLGIALKDSGNLDEAISSYQQAIEIKPDYAEAYNNMGSALKDKAAMPQAIECYEKALEIYPDYTDAIWNRVGAADDIDEAEAWVRKCLTVNPNYIDAIITLSVLEYFKGDRKALDVLLNSSLQDHPAVRSLQWVAELPSLPALHFNRWSLFDAVVKQAVPDRPFYEFGVFTGQAFKYLMNTFAEGFGFDTFAGLPEDWHDEKAGSYSSGGSVPDIAGGEFIVGEFENTLPEFFVESRPVASVINFDADLYSSTICALNNAKPVIDNRTILIFDEFIVNEHWEQDEFKALHEFCNANDATFDVLAVSFFTKQVALRLVGI